MSELESLLVFAGLVAIMLVVGVGIGMLIGPRLGRLLDTSDVAETADAADTADDGDTADGADVDDEDEGPR